MTIFDMNPFHEFWTLLKNIHISHTARILSLRFHRQYYSLKLYLWSYELWFRFKEESNVLEKSYFFYHPHSPIQGKTRIFTFECHIIKESLSNFCSIHIKNLANPPCQVCESRDLIWYSNWRSESLLQFTSSFYRQ